MVRILSEGLEQRTALRHVLFSTDAMWIINKPFAAMEVAVVDWLVGILGAHAEAARCSTAANARSQAQRCQAQSRRRTSPTCR